MTETPDIPGPGRSAQILPRKESFDCPAVGIDGYSGIPAVSVPFIERDGAINPPHVAQNPARADNEFVEPDGIAPAVKINLGTIVCPELRVVAVGHDPANLFRLCFIVGDPEINSA
ncbi:hypothetical protein SDC9_139129 [bioreactor metagenome]|uniref:Uncharacterized protein n=1 Tax=bioreactor metagenome TaxID=1076179 RepID=A0A645DRV2_9ZZZZ